VCVGELRVARSVCAFRQRQRRMHHFQRADDCHEWTSASDYRAGDCRPHQQRRRRRSVSNHSPSPSLPNNFVANLLFTAYYDACVHRFGRDADDAGRSRGDVGGDSFGTESPATVNMKKWFVSYSSQTLQSNARN